MSGRDPTNDVQELKNELRKHETRIEELEQQLQQDRYCSTKKMKELEDEKKGLENEVNEIKRELQKKEAEMTSMKLSFEELLEHKLNAVTSQFKEEIKCLTKKTQDQENDLEKHKAETRGELEKTRKAMGEEIQFFVKKSQKHEKDLEKYMAKTDELEKSRNILYIGQLCAKVMEAIYCEVIPVYFEGDDYKQPHLKYINENIEQLYHNRWEQTKAKRRWRKLQAEKIDADEYNVQRLVDFMEEMLADRNEVAHPSPLNEKELKDIASELPGQKQQLFQKVIEISKKLFPPLAF